MGSSDPYGSVHSGTPSPVRGLTARSRRLDFARGEQPLARALGKNYSRSTDLHAHGARSHERTKSELTEGGVPSSWGIHGGHWGAESATGCDFSVGRPGLINHRNKKKKKKKKTKPGR